MLAARRVLLTDQGKPCQQQPQVRVQPFSQPMLHAEPRRAQPIPRRCSCPHARGRGRPSTALSTPQTRCPEFRGQAPAHRSPSNPDGRKGISTQVPYMPADNNPTRPPRGRLAPKTSANLKKTLSEISRILKSKPAARCSLTASGSAARQYWSHLGARCKAGAPYRPSQTVSAATAG